MKLNKYVRSFAYAISGIAYAFRNQVNMRFHFIAAAVVIATGYVLHISALEWCIIFLCIGSVIASELINTAIEVNVDLVTMERNEKAGQAKDLAAAAVLVICVISAIIGAIVFIPKIIHFI
jgi:diacylglycerol kinase